MAENKDIRLIHIFEDEWINKQNIVKKKIRHLLGMDKSKAVYARNCDIREIDSKTARLFLNENHLQGYCKCNYKYGLFNNDILVAVMTFNHGKISSKIKEWELNRYATSCKVSGGFGKLLKYAYNMLQFDKLITFADRRFSNKNHNIYIANDFSIEKITVPNYFYITNSATKRFQRFAFRKDILKYKLSNFDESLSEVENCKRNGLYRLFDCGHLKYVRFFDV